VPRAGAKAPPKFFPVVFIILENLADHTTVVDSSAAFPQTDKLVEAATVDTGPLMSISTLLKTAQSTAAWLGSNRLQNMHGINYQYFTKIFTSNWKQ
jgi:hypothetical protein